MPVEENPKTGTGVYYPPCGSDALYAYHGISATIDPEKYDPKLVAGPQRLIATEEAFRTIWQQGVIYSAVQREKQGIIGQSSMFFGMDRAAGDDEYVFLNVCTPHSAGEKGYHLVFDPYQLVSEGAIVGLDDLQGSYMSVAQNLRIEDRNDDSTWTKKQLVEFKKFAKRIHKAWRLDGQDAELWLEWIQGVLETYPINLEPIYEIDEEIRGYHDNIIKWMVDNRGSAIRYAELLIPDELPLEWLVGVIFRKQWVEIDDFIEVYGPPGTEPPPALEFHEAFRIDDSSAGHPARCSRCGDWMNLPLLEVPESGFWGSGVFRDQMKHKDSGEVMSLMVCKSCGAAFKRPGFGDTSFDEEEYVGQIEDFEYEPLSW
jgi:hypothetical protein